MTFDELMSSGWQEHDSATAVVADRLEAHRDLVRNAGEAAQYAALALHAVGQHLGDFPRAARLSAGVVERVPAEAALAPAHVSLAAARHLAGDMPGALASESRATALAPADAAAHAMRVRLLVAQGLLARGERAEAALLFDAALAAFEALESAGPVASLDRALGPGANNITSDLLRLADRSPAEDALLARGAEAARRAWYRIGEWTHHERADYLVALAMNALGRYAEAAAAAETGLATIDANGAEPVDAAFLRLALAAARRGAGDHAAFDRTLAEADTLASGFSDDAGLRDWFAGERAKVVESAR